MLKRWEKIDQWVAFVLGILVLKLMIAFVLWAETIVKSKTILRWIFGWLF